MITKVLLVGEPGAGKTHTCVEICKVTKAVLLDVDGGAEPIIQKLGAEDIERIDATSYSKFIKGLKQAVSSDADVIIVDSMTELKEVIKRHIKSKILQKGEFYIGGIERDEPKKVSDPDLFLVTWELFPVIYDKLRDIIRSINSAGKSAIFTYHPQTKVSKGEANILLELKRIVDIVAEISEDTVILKKDRILNLGSITQEEFIDYIKKIISAENIKEVE